MVLTKDEFMEKLKTVIGDRTDDEALTIIEDFTDTYDDLDGKVIEKIVEDPEDWKGKYEALDEEWRKKYKERFFSGDTVEEKEVKEEEIKEDDEDEEESVEEILDKMF